MVIIYRLYGNLSNTYFACEVYLTLLMKYILLCQVSSTYFIIYLKTLLKSLK